MEAKEAADPQQVTRHAVHVLNPDILSVRVLSHQEDIGTHGSPSQTSHLLPEHISITPVAHVIDDGCDESKLLRETGRLTSVQSVFFLQERLGLRNHGKERRRRCCRASGSLALGSRVGRRSPPVADRMGCWHAG